MKSYLNYQIFRQYNLKEIWLYYKIVILLLLKLIANITKMKWKELMKILEAHGYQFDGHGRKHDRYLNPNTGEVIMVEWHGS